MLRKDSNGRRPRPVPSGAKRNGRGRGVRGASADERFVLYVEGARDRELLETWARRLEPATARCIERSTVILGGRQPARAVRDFRKRGGAAEGWSGLVVLDRDHHEGEADAADGAAGPGAERGLELFVWSLRHIESYVLVPSAIRRVLGSGVDPAVVDRLVGHHATPGEPASIDVGAAGEPREGLHAKRMLGAGGALSEALGVELRAGEIARAMRLGEIHDDVRALIRRIGLLSGAVDRGPEVVIRPPRR